MIERKWPDAKITTLTSVLSTLTDSMRLDVLVHGEVISSPVFTEGTAVISVIILKTGAQGLNSLTAPQTFVKSKAESRVIIDSRPQWKMNQEFRSTAATQ